MSNRTTADLKNAADTATDLMNAGSDAFKTLDEKVRDQLIERPYTILGLVFAAGWLYSKMR